MSRSLSPPHETQGLIGPGIWLHEFALEEVCAVSVVELNPLLRDLVLHVADVYIEYHAIAAPHRSPH